MSPLSLRGWDQGTRDAKEMDPHVGTSQSTLLRLLSMKKTKPKEMQGEASGKGCLQVDSGSQRSRREEGILKVTEGCRQWYVFPQTPRTRVATVWGWP